MLEKSKYEEIQAEQFTAVPLQAVQIPLHESHVFVALFAKVPRGHVVAQVDAVKNQPLLQLWQGDGLPVHVAQLPLQVAHVPELL